MALNRSCSVWKLTPLCCLWLFLPIMFSGKTSSCGSAQCRDVGITWRRLNEDRNKHVGLLVRVARKGKKVSVTDFPCFWTAFESGCSKASISLSLAYCLDTSLPCSALLSSLLVSYLLEVLKLGDGGEGSFSFQRTLLRKDGQLQAFPRCLWYSYSIKHSSLTTWSRDWQEIKKPCCWSQRRARW